jgi:NAD(P)-dependent dehydrogenase (short-subunit alcohol dehydrogenase family)
VGRRAGWRVDTTHVSTHLVHHWRVARLRSLTGIYHASTWALEGISETLRQEVEPFGIKVLMVEPSGFGTDWAGSSMDRAKPIDAYQEIETIAERRSAQQEDNEGSQPGNPDLAARALLDTLDRDDPPFRLLLGNVAYDTAIDRDESRLKEFHAGEQVARGADDR